MGQTSLFDFTTENKQIYTYQTEQKTQASKSKNNNPWVAPVRVDIEDVPEMSRDFVLSEIKDLISSGILQKSDKYFRFFLDRYVHVFKQPFDESMFKMMATPMSDSAIFLEVYEYGVPGINGGMSLIPVKDYLLEVEKRGGYIKAAWNMFIKDKKATPKDIMDYFKIYDHVTSRSYAEGTQEECLRAANALLAWNRDYIGTDEEMIENKELNFMRVSRKKKKQEDPACFDGNCLEKNIINGKIAIFGREVE